MRQTHLLFIVGLAYAWLASGCAPLVVGGAAVAGASILHDRRPPQTILEDHQLELAAQRLLAEDDELERRARLAANSYNRSVLLTGQAESAELARRAVDQISRLPKVARVIDEIRIGPPLTAAREAADLALAARAKLELAAITLPDFDPTRVKVVVADSVVYLLGLVTPREAELVTERIRFMPGVRTVVALFEYWMPNA